MSDTPEYHPDPNLPENYAVMGPDANGMFVFGRIDIPVPLETFHGSYLQLVKMLRRREALPKPKPQNTK